MRCIGINRYLGNRLLSIPIFIYRELGRLVQEAINLVPRVGDEVGKLWLFTIYDVQIPGNSACWNVNGKRFFGSSHWKIPGTNGNSEKVVLFSRLGLSECKFVYHFIQVS